MMMMLGTVNVMGTEEHTAEQDSTEQETSTNWNATQTIGIKMTKEKVKKKQECTYAHTFVLTDEILRVSVYTDPISVDENFRCFRICNFTDIYHI